MKRFLISLDELDRVKRMNNLGGPSDLQKATGVSRPIWSRAIKERKPTPAVLEALAQLGARPNKILVLDEASQLMAA